MASLSSTLLLHIVFAYFLAFDLHLAHAQFIWSSLLRPGAAAGSGLPPGVGHTPTAQTVPANGATMAPGTAGLGTGRSTVDIQNPSATISRNNCLVYQASGNETLQQVASSFNLREDDVLSDNQGVVSGPRDSLEGRSILLCSRNGQLPQASIPLLLLPSTRTARPAQAPAVAPAPTAATTASSPSHPATPGTEPKPSATGQASNAPFVPPIRQMEGLLAMKAYLDPGNKVLVDWRDKLDHCTWIYVTCDDYKNVIRLNLVYLNLEGKLPPARIMNNLPYLKQLFLGGNKISGTLPADWGRSLRTAELYLNDNMLQGSIPVQWGDMKTLRVLSLTYNQLQSTLPPALGQLVSLRVLKLNDNMLSGSVPQAWAGLEALQTLTLFNNQNVTGCVPEIWRGKGRTGKGYFQSPQGLLSDDIKVATIGTSIQGYCCKGWKYCI